MNKMLSAATGATSATTSAATASLMVTLEEAMREWTQLNTRRGGVAAAQLAGWWRRIVACYTEPQRAYHSMQHVLELLTQYHAKQQLVRDKDAFLYTLFFHDAVYDPTRGDNEELSAQLFLDFCGENDKDLFRPVFRDKVARYIRRTQSHTTCPDDEDADCLLFLDMDLAILGASKERYAEYAAQIRREYSHVPRQKYLTGRAKVLSTFLAAKRLYKTDVFHAELDEAMRINLQWEISLLRLPETTRRTLTVGDASNVFAFQQANIANVQQVHQSLTEAQIKHALALNYELCWVLEEKLEARSSLLAATAAAAIQSSEGNSSSGSGVGKSPTGAAEQAAVHRSAADAFVCVIMTTKTNAARYQPKERRECDYFGNHLLLHWVQTALSHQHKTFATVFLKDFLLHASTKMKDIERVSLVCASSLQGFFEKQGFELVEEVVVEDFMCFSEKELEEMRAEQTRRYRASPARGEEEKSGSASDLTGGRGVSPINLQEAGGSNQPPSPTDASSTTTTATATATTTAAATPLPTIRRQQHVQPLPRMRQQRGSIAVPNDVLSRSNMVPPSLTYVEMSLSLGRRQQQEKQPASLEASQNTSDDGGKKK